jgi:AraC-like DNA-binding protein
MAAEPVGRYTSGEGWLHFCATAELWGVVLWGRPRAEATTGLVRSLACELMAPAVPHVSLVDTRAVDGVDTGAFDGLVTYVQRSHEALADQVRRLALVRGAGLEGAVVAGFFEVLPRPYPVAVFDAVSEALDWLAVDHPAGFDDDLEAVVAELRHTPPVVSALGAHLESHLEGPAIAVAAKELGMSERTLQRRLKEANTSFVDQVAQVRVRVAKRLLLDSDTALTAIALDVGCSSPQHFSAMFRKLCGESPSTWRARHRG